MICSPIPGNAVPRAMLAGDRYNGGFFKGLVREAARLGIEVLDHVMVIDLLRQGRRRLRSGGAGNRPGNPPDRSGQIRCDRDGRGGKLVFFDDQSVRVSRATGCALAYEAGTQLSDMEFVQSRACMIRPEAMRGTPPPGDGGVTIGGRFYNGLCERYMKKYHPDKAEQVTRAEVARCTQKEILEGRASPHGGVYGDFSGVPREKLMKFKAFMRACASSNFDPTWQSYEWAPGAHYFMGGIVINERCETGSRRTVCRGRGAVGYDGRQPPARKRPHGNAGFRRDRGGTGVETGPLARTCPPFRRKSSGRPHRTSPPTGTGTMGSITARSRKDITELMSRYAGVIRNEEGLRKALKVMDEIGQKKLDRLCIVENRSFGEMARLFETRNIHTVGRLILQAALLRTESRGAHNREDYPEMSDAWRKNIVFQRKAGKTDVSIKEAASS